MGLQPPKVNRTELNQNFEFQVSSFECKTREQIVETRNLKPETGFTAISVKASARDDVNHPLAAI